MSNKHNKYFNCLKCPKPIYPKSKNVSLFSGSTNKPDSLLSPGMTHARKINISLVGHVGWTPTYYYSQVNVHGQRAGAPGGSKAPPKNSF